MTTLAERKRKNLINACHTIMCTAAEGGIGYWSILKDYQWSDEGEVFRVEPMEGWVLEEETREEQDARIASTPPQFTVSAESLADAIEKLFDDMTQPRHLRMQAASVLVDPVNADIDACDADNLFQYAALGSVVYG